MPNVKKLIFITCATLGIAVFQPWCAHADWFSSLTDRIQTNNPAAWEGQQRGYFTGGGVSYRAQTNTVPLVNLQAPRIQAGCGGIDAFWGGFGYLNADYLVQALQNVMTAAPAYAFKLALQNLCDPCDDVMTSIQQMAQALNNIALDECGTAQGLVNMGGDAIASLIGKDASEGTSSSSNWVSEKAGYLTRAANSISSSITELQNWQYCGGFENHSDEWSQCAKIVDIRGSMWEKAKDINTDKTSTDGSRVDEIFIRISRAAFGDMIITDSTSMGDSASLYDVKFEPPCSDMTAQKFLQGMLGNLTYTSQTVQTEAPKNNPETGQSNDSARPSKNVNVPSVETEIKIMTRDIIGTGTSVTGVGQCIQVDMPESLQVHKRASNAIQEIIGKMAKNHSGELSADTIEIIKESTIPIYQLINMFSYRTQHGSVISPEEQSALVKLASLGYTQYLIESYIIKAESILDQAYLQFQRSAVNNIAIKDNIDSSYNAIKSKIQIFRGSFLVDFARTQEILQKSLKDQLEYMRLRDYYMGILKNRGMLNAYRGLF